MKSLGTRLLVGALLWMVTVIAALNVVISLIRPLNLEKDTWRLIHIVMLSIVAVSAIAGGLWLVRRSLRPLRELRDQLAAMREGHKRKVEGRYPSEVQPLVDDLNALLEDRERAVTRAQTTAGDLAHGLKTPLAVLAREAECAEAAGHRELAATIGQQVERMRRQIESQLVQARATASAGAAPGMRCSVLASVEGLARTMLRLHADRGVTIDVRVAPQHAIRGQREDLDEMLGNLLDNACKWARSQVIVESKANPASIVILIDDDGAGLAPSMRDAVLQRGVRADEASPGSGLGLSIVRSLAELYGGTIALEASPLGGVRARLELPAVAKWWR